MAEKEKRYEGETVYREYPDGEPFEVLPVKPIKETKKNATLNEIDDLRGAARETREAAYLEFDTYGNLESLEKASGAMAVFRDKIVDIYKSAKTTANTTTQILKEQVYKKIIPAIGVTALGGIAYQQFGEIAVSLQESHPFLSVFPEFVCAAGFFAMLGGAIGSVMYSAGAIEAGVDRKRNLEIADYAKSKVKGIDVARKDVNNEIAKEESRREFMSMVAANRESLVDDLENGRI